MKDNSDFDELLKNLNEKNLDSYAKTHLSEKKQRQLKEILGDEKKLNSVLNSAQAKEIMKKLRDRQNGKH